MRPGDLLEQRYRLVRVLGRGRSGTVWCARNELIDRAVAVKVLHRSLASDPERLQRFFQEARACGRVRHPSVVEVLDLGQGDDGVLFLVMELLEGETMASLLGRKGRLSVDEALALVIPLAHGLAAAHAHGILHRDLKPANIYLHKTPTGGLQPKILDFGISKIIGNDVTATGVVLGTPSYMSPEQARGVPDLDPRTDVWSLGVILYECLAGRLPFIAKEYRALVDEIIERKQTPVDQVAPEVPHDVAKIVDEALEKSRDRRLPSASAMAQKLTAVLRARGRDDMLRDPDDEFSEGAPTLAKDRDKVMQLAQQAQQQKSLPQPQTTPKGAKIDADETVGDHQAMPAMVVGPAPEVVREDRPQPSVPSNTRSGVGPMSPGKGLQPSAITALIAAQTSGAKRIEHTPLPRPAAGAPAKKGAEKGETRELFVASPRIEENKPEETRPDPMPLARKVEGPKPEPARGANTQSWEVSVGQAASGRAEVILGSGLPPSPMRVDEDWDTTVADVSAGEITEKGPLPKFAPAPPASLTDPPPAKGVGRADRSGSIGAVADKSGAHKSNGNGHRDLASEAPKKTPAFGAIPGFTAAPPPSIAPAAPPMTSLPSGNGTRRTGSTPPPPRTAPSTPPPPVAARNTDAPSKKGPPRPPPKTIPPNGASGLHQATLRPPNDGFAVPGPSPSQLPTQARPSNGAAAKAANARPSADVPLLAPELYALGEEKIEQPFALVNGDRSENHVAPASDRGSAESAPRLGDGNGHATALATSIPADPHIETDRRRAGPSLIPLMIAAVAVLFFFGAAVGTVAASRRGETHEVRRFANATALLVAWHERAAQQQQEQEAATKAADEEAQKKAAAEAAAKKAAEDAAASASASASASAAPPPEAPSVEPPKVVAPKPTPHVTKPTSTKSVSKPTNTTPKKSASSSDSPPKKKSGEKEWWQKKF